MNEEHVCSYHLMYLLTVLASLKGVFESFSFGLNYFFHIEIFSNFYVKKIVQTI
jgi:hypothetical protein